VQALVQRVTAALLHGARVGCIAKKHPEWEGDADQWLRDPLIRKVAIAAAIDELQAIERVEAAGFSPPRLDHPATPAARP
jgi:hypothetical protein